MKTLKNNQSLREFKLHKALNHIEKLKARFIENHKERLNEGKLNLKNHFHLQEIEELKNIKGIVKYAKKSMFYKELYNLTYGLEWALETFQEEGDEDLLTKIKRHQKLNKYEAYYLNKKCYDFVKWEEGKGDDIVAQIDERIEEIKSELTPPTYIKTHQFKLSKKRDKRKRLFNKVLRSIDRLYELRQGYARGLFDRQEYGKLKAYVVKKYEGDTLNPKVKTFFKTLEVYEKKQNKAYTWYDYDRSNVVWGVE